MRKSREETAATRRRIVQAAVQVFKGNGVEATGIAEVMAAAGLTHGGFYRHFASKEQLLAEACAASMEALISATGEVANEGPEAAIAHIGNFLSPDYHDDMLSGCLLVAMGSELARADTDTRRIASQGIEDLIEIVSRWRTAGFSVCSEGDAIFVLSSMIGAASLSRIVDDPALSRHILDNAKVKIAEQLWQQAASKSMQDDKPFIEV